MSFTLLCVHPHPDDESIACGGVLARTADTGHRPVVVTCTAGEEGENLAGIDLGGVPLVDHRRRELAAALDVLGVGTRHQLAYRDSGMAGTPSNEHPEAFCRADVHEAAGRLAGILRLERPDVVVSDDAKGTYGHPDHVRAHEVTVAACAMAADPRARVEGEPFDVPKRYVHTISRSRLLRLHEALVSASLPSPFEGGEVTFGAEDAEVTARVDVRPWLGRKRAAMAAHASQIGPDSFFLNIPADSLDDLFGVEEFVLMRGHRPEGEGSEPEDDLFSGLGEVMR